MYGEGQRVATLVEEAFPRSADVPTAGLVPDACVPTHVGRDLHVRFNALPRFKPGFLGSAEGAGDSAAPALGLEFPPSNWGGSSPV